MEVYHMLLVFFPIALLNTAFLFVVIRAFSGGSLAMTLEKSIVPLIFLGLVAGAAAYVLGLLAWPFSALTATPLGRNHVILATLDDGLLDGPSGLRLAPRRRSLAWCDPLGHARTHCAGRCAVADHRDAGRLGCPQSFGHQ